MKKLYTILTLSMCFLFFAAQAQTARLTTIGLKGTPVVVKNGNPSIMSTDTLVPPSFGSPMMCDTALYYYYIDGAFPIDSGYAFGNNVYGETECGEKYYATGTVSEVLVAYGHKNGTNGTTNVKIYSVSPTTAGPLTALGTSGNITTGNLTLPGINTYTFATPVAVTTAFVASVTLPNPATGDTVAILGTDIKTNCSSTDSLAWADFPNFGGWLNTIAAFGINLDFYILPVVTTAGGVAEYPSSNGLTLKGAYPSPAVDATTIRYSIVDNSEVSVKVFDLSGRTIMESQNFMSAGSHEFKVNVKNLSAGNYYYTITTSKTQLTSKFAVVK